MNKTALILIVAALLIFAAAGYMLFGKSATSGVVSESVPPTQAELTFIALTERIDPVEFDSSILRDPRFASLRDIRTAILPETAGRNDPFAAFGR